MSWTDYKRLIDNRDADPAAWQEAAKSNPNDPRTACKLAVEKSDPWAVADALLVLVRGTPTPGPWTVDRSQIRDAHGNALASVPYTLGDEQDRANAQLIASAPEMAETIARARRHTSAALQRIRIAIDYLDENNTQAGRDFAKDAQAEISLAFAALGGEVPTDAERLKAGQPVACALCGRQVTNDDRGATPGDEGQVICGACNGGIR